MSAQFHLLAFIHGLLPAVLLIGCGQSGPQSSQRTGEQRRHGQHLPGQIEPLAESDSRLPVVSGPSLETRIRSSERPLLVEFGVNFGCYRCDRMRPDMTRLSRDFKGRVDVVRVDFNANRQLAAQFGTTVCPSYVLFNRGSVVAKRSFPTSADLLATDLRSILTNDDGAER